MPEEDYGFSAELAANLLKDKGALPDTVNHFQKLAYLGWGNPTRFQSDRDEALRYGITTLEVRLMRFELNRFHVPYQNREVIADLTQYFGSQAHLIKAFARQLDKYTASEWESVQSSLKGVDSKKAEEADSWIRIAHDSAFHLWGGYHFTINDEPPYFHVDYAGPLPEKVDLVETGILAFQVTAYYLFENIFGEQPGGMIIFDGSGQAAREAMLYEEMAKGISFDEVMFEEGHQPFYLPMFPSTTGSPLSIEELARLSTLT